MAHEKNFAALQGKLKECIAKQSASMDGLERLAQQLGNDDDASPELQNFDDVTKSNTTTTNGSGTMIVEGEDGVADANETTTARVATDGKGENKAPAKKHRRGRKYSYMHRGKGEPKNKDSEKPKKKPKYFCQF